MHPVFLSVSSIDEKFANAVWKEMPSDWAYLYSESGVEGAEMWDEISKQELPTSKYIIIFWSKNYVRASGCIRELRQSVELVAGGIIEPLVLRLDEFPIVWNDDLPEDLKPVFSDLSPMLSIRTSRANISAADAIPLVQRFVEPALNSAHPMLHRDDILEPMRVAMKKERFKSYPAMWISGFPGAGRSTLVQQINNSMVPNGRHVPIDINATSLPKQICLKLESIGLGADMNRLEEVQNAEEANSASGVISRIDKIFSMGNYVIFRHGKILQNNVDLPEWFDEVIVSLKPESRPKLFILSQMPLSIDRRKKCYEQLAEQRVSGFSNYEVVSFAEILLAHFDLQPDRWSAKTVDNLIEAAQGNIGLLVALTQAVSSLIDISEANELIEHAKSMALQSIAYYVDWAFSSLHDDLDSQRLLLFLNDVSPCDHRDLSFLSEDMERPILGTLTKCLKLGLVERDSSGLYRLTPFLSGRLARHLVRADLVEWRRSIIENFAKSPVDFDASENEYIRIEARIQASLWSGADVLPPVVEKFVSASHWFQAGIRLYHAHQNPAAHRLLKKAFDVREGFSQASRTELLRYLGLAAIRTENTDDVETCITLLNSDRKNRDIASYLEAFKLENEFKYYEAVRKYEEALDLNEGKGNRLERIYRALIKCILLTAKPDYQAARSHAVAWGLINQTVFRKHALCRIYLLWLRRGASQQYPAPSNLKKLYDDALVDLRAHPGGEGTYHEILAEEAELAGLPKQAVEELETAIRLDNRFELRLKRWQIMARDKEMASSAMLELEEMKSDPRQSLLRESHMKGLVEIFVTAMTNSVNNQHRLNKFATPLGSREIGAIVGRVKRRASSR